MKMKRIIHLNYLNSLIVTLLFVSVLPLLIFFTASFFSFNAAFENEVRILNEDILARTVRAIELVTEQISTNCRQLTLRRSVTDFEMHPPYEGNRILSELTDEEILSLSEYWGLRNRVFDEINTLQLSSDLIESVYFYDSKKRIVLSSNWMETPIAEFHDTGWIDLMKEVSFSKIVWDTRWRIRPEGRKEPILTLVFQSSLEVNACIVNISFRKFYNEIIRELDRKHSSGFYIFSRSGKLLLYDPEKNRQQETVTASGYLEILGKSRIKMHRERDLLLLKEYSGKVDWECLSIVDVNHLFLQMKRFRISLFIVSCLLGTGAVFFCIHSGRRLYAPLSRLVFFVREQSPESDPGIDEIRYLDRSIKHIFSTKEELQRKLNETLPALREKTLQGLLSGRVSNETEIRHKMNLLKIDLPLEELLVLVLEVHNFSRVSQDILSLEILKIQILEIISKQIGETGKGISFEGEKGFVILLNRRAGSSVFAFAEDLKSQLMISWGLVSSIGIGGPAKGISDLPVSYQDAMEALKYVLTVGKGETISIEDMRMKKVEEPLYPKAKETILHDYIKNGATENAIAVFHSLIRDFSFRENQIPYYRIQQIFIRLFSNLIDIAQEEGINWIEYSPGEPKPFRSMINMDELEVTEDWLSSFIERITDAISRGRACKNNYYVQKIMAILSADCSAAVSLNAVADKMNINQAYAGRIFKENTGRSFVEYLTDLRMKKSRELLKSSEITVKAVSRQLGYSDSYYFIKLFKTRFGITPGAYRKLHSPGKWNHE